MDTARKNVQSCHTCGRQFRAVRSDARTCSPRCRQRLSRARRAPLIPCHQARPPAERDAAIAYTVERIEAAEAHAFIRRYEYLGTVGHAAAFYGARTADG